MSPSEFVDVICSLRFEHAFNPYANECPIHDLPRAAEIRKNALKSVLDVAVRNGVDSIWIGRDLGYRGGRRTGIPFTDDVHLSQFAMRWGISLRRSTKGPPMAERTAAVIWQMLDLINVPIIPWNAFPLHPHEVGDPFTNRAHNSREGKAGAEILMALLQMLQPRRLIAIGNDAARVTSQFTGTWTHSTVRHPSYGGQTEFVQKICELYGVTQSTRQGVLL